MHWRSSVIDPLLLDYGANRAILNEIYEKPLDKKYLNRLDGWKIMQYVLLSLYGHVQCGWSWN